jgi:predicted short-subunit dehydrogenase-like oxidoreductase (DUF2520 family)
MAVRTARKIARVLGAAPTSIEPAKKPLYHAAGSLAAGHALVVVESAVQLLMSIGIKRTEAVRALLPMTKQMLQNYERLGARAALDRAARAWRLQSPRQTSECLAEIFAAVQGSVPSLESSGGTRF